MKGLRVKPMGQVSLQVASGAKNLEFLHSVAWLETSQLVKTPTVGYSYSRSSTVCSMPQLFSADVFYQLTVPKRMKTCTVAKETQSHETRMFFLGKTRCDNYIYRFSSLPCHGLSRHIFGMDTATGVTRTCFTGVSHGSWGLQPPEK